jgi:hypothetical protein
LRELRRAFDEEREVELRIASQCRILERGLKLVNGRQLMSSSYA